jgi:hypothetical protein
MTMNHKTRFTILLAAAFGLLSKDGFTQSLETCPGTEPTAPNNTLPRVIFPTTPVVGRTWYACYQNPTPCNSAYRPNPFGPNPEPHLAVLSTPQGYDLKTQWLEVSFGVCPYKSYLTASMPAPQQAGPITIRMFQRTADGIENLPFFPFVQTFEQVIQVQAAPISSVGVPGLDWRAMLGLSVLIIGVAGMGRRR